MPLSSNDDIRNPWDEIGGLYTALRLIAEYHDHPARGRACRSAAILGTIIRSMGAKPVEPDVDPVFGPASNPRPVRELDDRFSRLFLMLARIDGMRDVAHVVNGAWAEFDLVDPDAFPLPDHAGRSETFPVSGMGVAGEGQRP